ncbi:MAG TPA: RDD family protein [Candidatus Acidoferrum sp.]|jgi:uncharacterized RDD family membrane protein YckC|nr:RDD family protein [Candidatus Acidoferrum sp.]
MDEAPAPRPAGFWIRAVAFAIDLIVFALVQRSFGMLATLLMGPSPDGDGSAHGSAIVFTLLFTAAYTTVLHTVAGQTIGKSLVGVRVVGMDGALLTAGPALLRYLSYYISLIPLGFGFLVAALRRDKRALHDLIAGSRVERLPSRRRVARRGAPARPPVGTLQEPAVRHANDPEPGA